MFVCFLFNVLVADDFRIFCGDLGNEVNDDILARAFSRYPSFLKAKVGSLLLISATLQGSDGSDETKKEQRSTGVLVPWACYSPVHCIMRTSRPAPRRKREKQTWWKPKLWHLVCLYNEGFWNMSRRCLFSADRSQIAVAKFQFDVLPYSRERERAL